MQYAPLTHTIRAFFARRPRPLSPSDRKRKKLRFDRLEDRTVPAIDITSFNTVTGTVTFSGDRGGTTNDTLVLSEVNVNGQTLLAHNLIGSGTTGNFADATDIDPTANVAHLVIGSGLTPLISANLGAGINSVVLAGSWTFGTPLSVTGSGTDSLSVAGSTAATWNINGASAGNATVNGNLAATFSGLDTLQAGSGDDVFNLNADFAGTLRGGAGNDRFVVGPGVSLTGTLDGQGGNDTLDLSALATATNVALTAAGLSGFSGAVSGVGNFAGIDNLVGGSGNNTLTGANLNSIWDVGTTTKVAAGAASLTASGFGTLQGGSARDLFRISANATADLNGGAGDDVFAFTADNVALTGTINGQAGNDILSYAGTTVPVSVNLGTSQATGVSGFTGIENFIGGTGLDTLTGADAATTWILNGLNAGLVNSAGNVVRFMSFENLKGGSANDVFALTGIGRLSGTLDGGGGINTLSGGSARSPILFRLLGSDSGTISTLGSTASFSNIANLTGGLGSDVFVLSVGASLSGRINGSGGSDTLDYSAFVTGVTVNLMTGVAPGVGGGVINVDNVRGGSGDDVLIGNNGANLLIGNGGNDVLVGNGGNDILVGGAGRDILIGGDGADILLGGADEDILLSGRTTMDANVTALNQLMAQWANTSIDYIHRVNSMQNTLRNAIDDGSTDVLVGGSDALDWFLSSKNDILLDANNPKGERRTHLHDAHGDDD